MYSSLWEDQDMDIVDIGMAMDVMESFVIHVAVLLHPKIYTCLYS